MNTDKQIILFGVKSPLAVDYQETIERAGLKLTTAISVGSTVRLLNREKLKPLAECKNGIRPGRFIACAFVPSNRRKLSQIARENRYVEYPGLIDPTAVVSRSSRIGVGTYLNAGVVLGGQSIISEHVFINRASSVGHHYSGYFNS
ncbi:hypothetical protein [Sulfitobacter sp. SK012]|uniref:hypothetical protein n=1 Tax=Sulfitobacter sp. SK012 TaxID=1389005 RepID=UPI0013B3B672|nr:hypothetical protein [Sulfitobacter sp. SK012]